MKKLLIISLFIGTSMQASEWDNATDAMERDDLKSLQAAYYNDPTILTQRYPNGGTLLQAAEFELAEFLIMRGIDVNAQSDDGRTALMIAVHFGNDDVVELLLRHGARTDIRDRAGSSVFNKVPGKFFRLNMSDPRVVRIKKLLAEAQAKEAAAKKEKSHVPAGD